MSHTDLPMTVYTAAENAKSHGPANSRSQYYNFSQMLSGSTAVIRLLPDANEDNSLGYIETDQIRLPFAGTINSPDGDDTLDKVTVGVPAMSTWGREDAITRDIKPLWSGSDDDKNIARTYWRKRNRIMPCLIVASPFKEKMEPESPIRLVRFTKQLTDAVNAGLMNADFEYMPNSYQHGRDFNIVKTQQGVYGNYSTSGFKYKERPLSAAELAMIEKYGLIDLSVAKGIEPDRDVQAMIFEMYKSSRAGEAFDVARWGNYFRHFAATPQLSQEETAAVTTEVSAAARANAAATLARLKSRNTGGNVANPAAA